MTSQFFSEQSAQQIEAIKNDPPHGLLIEGVVGMGLFHTAQYLGGANVISIVRPTDSKGLEDTESGSIKIAQIRSLYDMTKGKATIRQVIIIDNADTMGAPAQNAFLKLLEEPLEHVHFILTAHHPEKLLPTVLSRVQRLRLTQIAPEQTAKLLDELHVTDSRKRTQLEFVAAGLPAEIIRLASNTSTFDTKVRLMTDARSFLQGTAAEKLGVINAYQSKRSDTLALIEAAQTILSRTIATSPDKQTILRANELVDIHERIVANGNIRLQLLAAVV